MPTKKVPVTKVRSKKVAKKTVKKKPVKKTVKKATKKTTKKTVKKTAKKSVKKPTKKATKKSAKKSSKKELVYADNQTSFWTSDGQVFNSLIALHDALENMDSYVYEYHAEGSTNDFAEWVEVVLCDDDCAAALRRTKTKKGARTVIVKHLKFYSE